MIRRLNNSIAQLPVLGLMLIGFAVVLLIGLLDYLTGYEMSFSLFYLIPVGFGAWYAGRAAGIGMSLASAVVWQLSNKLAGEMLSSPLIYVWNTGIRLATFFVVTILLYELRVALANERNLSRTDSLTGAVNRRAFYDTATIELSQARRYKRPLTIAYIDLDNFRGINNRFGHSTGDTLLRTVATTIKKSVRETDTVARLGGDEFAILFPSTDGTRAKKPLTKVRHQLQQAMDQHSWPVTFSIGVLTCSAPSATIEDLMQEADRVMYRVKKTGKDDIKYATYRG